ncbi:MAG: SGNH/GDSL hydrolase family protein [Clostridia bacterium]|nr:SGNH/GDSL hydrolase family protein [Clostridia bacterium]
MTKEYTNRTRLLWLILVAVLLAALLIFLQCLLVPKHGDVPEGLLVGEYYETTTSHNLLFVGDCEVYESFSTVTLWEEYGISSYIRGSAQQLIWQSYYLLLEMIEHGERPEAVVYNVLAMKYDDPQHEEYNRMTLDGMEWSRYKRDAIRASMTDDEDFLSYVFPILRYHDRISELKREDFTALFSKKETVSYNGYLMQTGVVPMEEEIPFVGFPDELISDYCFGYLDKMRTLCEENGIKLILVKAPTNNWKYHWYDEWDAQIREYAAANELSYYNFIGLDEEIGLDYTTDTYDAGIHLNVYGAEKMSRYFGKILTEELGLSDLRSDTALSEEWKVIAERYENEKSGK